MSGKLEVLSLSEDIVPVIYSLCKKLPKEEQFIIIPQICRAAISIPSNIAEGSQKSPKDFIRFINIARGSIAEVITQLNIINKIYKLEVNNIITPLEIISKMTYNLKLKLNTQVQGGGNPQ